MTFIEYLALVYPERNALNGMDQENYIDTIILEISVLSWTHKVLSSWMQHANREGFFDPKDLFSRPCCTWGRIESLGKVYSTCREVSVNLTLSLSWTNCNIYPSNRLLLQQSKDSISSVTKKHILSFVSNWRFDRYRNDKKKGQTMVCHYFSWCNQHDVDCICT